MTSPVGELLQFYVMFDFKGFFWCSVCNTIAFLFPLHHHHPVPLLRRNVQQYSGEGVGYGIFAARRLMCLMAIVVGGTPI